ncbi:hypothetical protein BDW74DRAFT_109163 [Aspergillus multicolor]|uniref:NOPCHAP1/New4 family protein n=1 Tax=Aspergillus multicolor TaxID=41759 RepID=UPI003CCCA78E
MDNVPQKRPEQPDGNNHASPSPAITLPNRPRTTTVDQQNMNVTSNGRRELSASDAVNARSASAPHDQDVEDDDYTSSSGSSLSSFDDDDDDDDAQSDSAGLTGDNEAITSLPARRKPNIRRIDQEPGLLSRLSAFLPQMKSANEDLEREIAAGRGKDLQLDDDGDEENDGQREGQYIEMNLGLGVLEEKRPGDEEDKEPSGSHGPTEDTDLMDRLMGKEKKSSTEKPSIQDLGE